MNYYNDYLQIYLPKLYKRYKTGDEQEKLFVEKEIFANKKLRKFQQRYIFGILIGKERYPNIDKDWIFKEYQ